VPWFPLGFLAGVPLTAYGGYRAVAALIKHRKARETESELEAMRAQYRRAMLGQYKPIDLDRSAARLPPEGRLPASKSAPSRAPAPRLPARRRAHSRRSLREARRGREGGRCPGPPPGAGLLGSPEPARLGRCV
jgi:hypothetical protein